MKFIIGIKYFHPGFSIGLEDIRNAWLIPEKGKAIQLKTVIHQGRIHYRMPVSGKRISYHSLKKGLVKQRISIRLQHEALPF